MPFASWPLYANSTKQKKCPLLHGISTGIPNNIAHICTVFWKVMLFCVRLHQNHWLYAIFFLLFCGEHGWCIGESSRFAPIWVGFRSWFVGWVCCWFSPLLWEDFSPVTLVFSLKTNTSKCQFDLNAQTLLKEFLRTSKYSMGKQITILFLIIFTIFDFLTSFLLCS